MDLLVLWRYFAQVTLDGNTLNEYFYSLPANLRDAALLLGEYIAGLLF